MSKSGAKKPFKNRVAKWLDECKLSISGVVFATRYPLFWAVFLPVFLIFGTLMNLLSGGTAAFSLFFQVDLGWKFKILGDGLLGLFGVNKAFFDFLLVFLIAVLQGILLALIVLVWKKRPKQQKTGENLGDAGIIAGLAVLGSGCPTCGTALLTPVLGAIFSGSGYAMAGAVSGVITIIAIIIAILSLKKVGLDAYVIIIDEKWRKKNEKSA